MDKAQSNAAQDLGQMDLTVVFLSPPPQGAVLPISLDEIGVYRPGHPPTIDHPPRLAT